MVGGCPTSFLRNQSTSSLSSGSSTSCDGQSDFLAIRSFSGLQFFDPSVPGTDDDEDEEYVTLKMMAFGRGNALRRPTELTEDPIREYMQSPAVGTT